MRYITLRILLLIGTIASLSSCQDGEDGVGNNQATQYGKITITLQGQDPEGNAFESQKEFAFTPNLSSSAFYYDPYYYYYESGIYVERVPGAFSDDVIEFYQVDEKFFPYFRIKYTVASNGKYFTVYDNFPNYVEESISGYNYNSETGSLKFDFTFTADADDNDTGYPLTITGVVDVKVVRASL